MQGLRFFQVKRSGDSWPVYFIPSAGTTALSLIPLARSAEVRHDILALELSEIQYGADEPITIRSLARECANLLLEIQPTGAFIIGGHCLGGSLAFEIAHRLEAAGREVDRLVLLESIPPLRESDRPTMPNGLDKEVGKAITALCESVRDRVATLPPRIAGHYGRLSRDLIHAALTYQAPGSIAAPIHHVHTATFPPAVYRSWDQLTTGDYGASILEGDAFSIIARPAVAETSRLFDKALRD